MVACPECGAQLDLGELHFAGMPIFVESVCAECDRVFFLDWPAGHALLHPVIVDCDTQTVHVGGAEWYGRRVLSCFASRSNPVSAEIRVHGECHAGRTAVVVNCIDYLYGHVLLKVMSVARHRRERPDDDVVVIIPKLLRWLVPQGVVQIEVDLPLTRGAEWLEGLDATVKRVLAPCASIRISPAVSQPEITPQDLEVLRGDLATTQSSSHSAPLEVGFILRDDRLWKGRRSLPLRVARRLLPKGWMHTLLKRRQQRNYADVARRVLERHPEARFVALGIGRANGFPNIVEDLRTPGPIREESAWLDEYRHCRVIVGMHGSAMLLPSLLGGAVVDLIPDEKLDGAFGTDVMIPRDSIPNPKLSLFRYRMLPEESSPATVAANVLSIIDGEDFQRRNFLENPRSYASVGWSEPPVWHASDIQAQ